MNPKKPFNHKMNLLQENMPTSFDATTHPHRRYNPLLDEWILVSPHRAKRPWQGQNETIETVEEIHYDPNCYLCPGNLRSNHTPNPVYEDCFVFENDFPALMQETVGKTDENEPLFQIEPEQGINKVICFSPKHHLTLPQMSLLEIKKIVDTWQQEYHTLGSLDFINYVQIFENKGAVMGCSNPHPHGQIWAQKSIPTLIRRTQAQLEKYFEKHQKTMLEDYVQKELTLKERIIFENESFVLLVPFWATWPFETMIVSKKAFQNIGQFNEEEKLNFAEMIQHITIKYDNIFETSFPYSAGIHQSPTDGKNNEAWHFHMHFYPPLLRSGTVKKFMVGYEMLAESQRDMTPEQSAERIRLQSHIHYKQKNRP